MRKEMLTYLLIEETTGRKVYEYYPEGNLNPGKVAFYSNGDKVLIEDSEDDFKGYYRGHAFSGIDQTKQQGTVAWC